MRILNNLFLTLSFSLFFAMSSQGQPSPKTYDAAWKKVQALIEKQLPQSALTEVKKIYQLAKKEKQQAQLIKSLVYMSQLKEVTREDNNVLSIKEMEAELKNTPEPASSILNSIIAGMYYRYYENNRWELMDRTRTTGFKKTDIKTWGAEDFHQKITGLYLQSVRSASMLQQHKLDKWEPVLAKGNMRHLRPTLFDLLAHEALEYFRNDERGVTKPAYAFEISEATAFAPAAEFSSTTFTTSDNLSPEFKALQLYQQLLAFHQQDARPDALLDADISRLEYVRQHATHPEKETLYLEALEKLSKKYPAEPGAAQAIYLQAAYWHDNAGSYKPFQDTANRYYNIKAKMLCEQILAQKDSSEGKINALNLLQELNEKTFSFKLETVNSPALPFRCLVEYKNIGGLHFRLIKANETIRKQAANPYEETFWPLLLKAPAFKSWYQPLPDTKDLQQHKTEIKIDGLGIGEYILIASADESFDKESLLGARYFYVSGISYINNDAHYFVLDRETGQPLADANVQVWETAWNSKLSRNLTVKGKNYRTDANGYFRFEKPVAEKNEYRYYNFKLDIRTVTDRLFLDESLAEFIRPVPEPEVDSRAMYLFTDRALYRPGQPLYFKGIALRKNSKAKTGGVIAGLKTTVYLRDANYRDVDSVALTTSAYGAIQGSFRLPAGTLNGGFTLYTKGEITGQAYFNVEEYKRPKFYVDYEPVKGAYKVNDTITVTGTAKAYAGNPIDGANVKYRIVRRSSFPYPWLSARWWMPVTDEMEISQGETKTDKDGKFTVRYTALPDNSIDRNLEPLFHYTVFADITDINGETRSGEKSVSVSYKSFIITSDIPAMQAADTFSKLWIKTLNLNDEFVPVQLTVTIHKLLPEQRLIRPRYWSRPDQFVFGREEYIRLFPHDEYDNETDQNSWKQGALISGNTDSSTVSGAWELAAHNWEPGFYTIRINGRNAAGEEITDQRIIELTSDNNNTLNQPGYAWLDDQLTRIQPGETAHIRLGTSAENLFVIQQVSGTEPSPFNFIRLTAGRTAIQFPVTEKERGGFTAGWAFVKHNRIFQLHKTIYVPWSNKELSVEYLSYRDKTLPGAEEKWKIRITGDKKETVAAEMLATMYDASLDQFHAHNWNRPYLWPGAGTLSQWEANSFTYKSSANKQLRKQQFASVDKEYDQLIPYTSQLLYGNALSGRVAGIMVADQAVAREVYANAAPVNDLEAKSFTMADTAAYKVNDMDGQPESAATQPSKPEPVQPRKNFNETAFFLPELHTDSTGAIAFSFTMPEALTRWKFMALAHTKDAAFGYSSKEIVTQKELMVQPNAPRFLREGDKMEFSAKIVNLTDKELTGTAQLELVDAITNQSVDGWFRNAFPNQYFTVAAGQSEPIFFPIDVPYLFNKALTWRIIARSGNYSDGEENTMPVLTNRMLVTESMPLNMKGTGEKTFRFEKLLNSDNSTTLQHQALTVEYTSNPVWYAVQSLPYLTEYPYECAEQSWNRYYANALAAAIANSNPKLKAVFEKWNIHDTTALLSNLQKNQELKAVLLEETPWVLDTKSEAQQKKNIALLFDLSKMTTQLNTTFEKFSALQNSNGGFSWFKGGADDRYITQYIVTGIGHLRKLNGIQPDQEKQLKKILAKAIPYLDKKILDDYSRLISSKTNLKTVTPDRTAVHYLYMRSFFPDFPVAAAAKKAVDYYQTRIVASWTKQSRYMQGMIALTRHRAGDAVTVKAILKSLKENSVYSEELGRYWKESRHGWFWYELPVETQALLVETFTEAGKDNTTADEIRTWLLKNKQTNNWKTTKATAEACYALLLRGSSWLSDEPAVTIQLGTGNNASVFSNTTAEAGTGYFKSTIPAEKINPQLGTIAVTVTPLSTSQPVNQSTWGSVYWQYFEDLDKITTAETPLKLSKKLFVQTNSDRGPVLTPLEEGQAVHVGDKIKVRIELRTDRDMEYVHMKDMRASALEPVNVLSSYKWQGGLGYYESTKDASTSFFFPYLFKGTYVFEYTLFVTHAGEFSNGITSIQCMYAPEFSAHSEGIRIQAEQ